MMLTIYVNVPAFAVFRYWDSLDLISLSTLVLVFGASVPMLVSCSLVMTKIFDIASEFQKNMKQKIQVYENKRMKKIWLKELRSCQVVRCHIGSFYHMEGKAKLTLVDTMANIFVFMVVQREME
jgi:hypothetical protein